MVQRRSPGINIRRVGFRNGTDTTLYRLRTPQESFTRYTSLELVMHKVFADNCAVCHGERGTGKRELGAPNLTDAIWLYGSDKADIATSIQTGRGGVMPAWKDRLDENTIKKLTVYIHSLGGGQ